MANKINILVTGAKGQVGQVFQELAKTHLHFHFIFTDKESLPIESEEKTTLFFKENQFDYCINAAAYTAVDLAETEKERALLLNATAVKNLATLCHQHQRKFIHFSTDYVFNGKNNQPYKSTDDTDPVNFYGYSKWRGEQEALQVNPSSLIIRTSWLYSAYGKNFVKTMLHLMQSREKISVVNDQFGSPTYAVDMCQAVLKIIQNKEWNPGIYHFCNTGIINWFQFANAIKQQANLACEITGINTESYPTAAKRPAYSALDTDKIRSTFKINIPNWEESLQACLKLLISKKV